MGNSNKLHDLLIERDGHLVPPYGEHVADDYNERGVGLEVDHILASSVCDHLGIPPKDRDHIDNKRLLGEKENKIRGVMLLSDAIKSEMFNERAPRGSLSPDECLPCVMEQEERSAKRVGISLSEYREISKVLSFSNRNRKSVLEMLGLGQVGGWAKKLDHEMDPRMAGLMLKKDLFLGVEAGIMSMPTASQKSKDRRGRLSNNSGDRSVKRIIIKNFFEGCMRRLGGELALSPTLHHVAKDVRDAMCSRENFERGEIILPSGNSKAGLVRGMLDVTPFFDDWEVGMFRATMLGLVVRNLVQKVNDNSLFPENRG